MRAGAARSCRVLAANPWQAPGTQRTAVTEELEARVALEEACRPVVVVLRPTLATAAQPQAARRRAVPPTAARPQAAQQRGARQRVVFKRYLPARTLLVR